MKSCENLCPHCGKCMKEEVKSVKKSIPRTEEGRINALLEKFGLKLVRIIGREEAACLLHDNKNAKVRAYDKDDYWISGKVELKTKGNPMWFGLCGKMTHGLDSNTNYYSKWFEVGIHMDKMNRDNIIFVLAESL